MGESGFKAPKDLYRMADDVYELKNHVFGSREAHVLGHSKLQNYDLLFILFPSFFRKNLLFLRLRNFSLSSQVQKVSNSILRICLPEIMDF